VLIEKPAQGDFLPIVDGGFDLQYSVLMEYRQGQGMILFCQMDVTARTQIDPAAATLTMNLIEYIRTWKPSQQREAIYVGEPAGKEHLEAAGIQARPYNAKDLGQDQVLIVGPGSDEGQRPSPSDVDDFLKSGGQVLALGLSQEEVDTVLPVKVTVRSGEHISTTLEPSAKGSVFAGIGPAEVHIRAPRVIPLISGGIGTVGNGVLAADSDSAVVFCQLVPWAFRDEGNVGLKRTFRRTSFLVTRLLCNLGARSQTPLLLRLATPVRDNDLGRWLKGMYLDEPEAWDDPYRFFRW
jgi:hypothetical protein